MRSNEVKALPSQRWMFPKWASQMRTAFASMASNTGCGSPADPLIICSTSDVAVCCSSASSRSRVSRATFVSLPAVDDLAWTAFRPLRRSGSAVLRRWPLIGSRAALERFFIATPWLRSIVAGQRPRRKVTCLYSSTNRYAANSSSGAFASFGSRVSNPSVNHP